MTRACVSLKFLLDRFQRVAVVGRQRGGQVGGHQIAAGDDVAELLDDARRLGGVVDATDRRRSENGVEPALGVHHRRHGGGDEFRLRLAQRLVLLVVLGSRLEPLARRRAEALDHVLDILHGLGER